MEQITRVLIAGAVVCLLALAPPTLAQGGGPYEMVWSTASGGGGSTGGQYGLESNVGQPAGTTLSGGGYTVTGGMEGAKVAPQAVTVTIARNSNDAVLTWVHSGLNTEYEVYRDTQPYFNPTPARWVMTVSVSQPAYTDPGAIGDTSKNYFYRVRAKRGSLAADARPVGEFDFGLVPGH